MSLAAQLAAYYELCDRHSATGLGPYLDRVVIDTVPPRRFDLVREPFQQERFQTLAPAVEYAAGLRDSYSGPLNFWLGYSKGHDKTSSVARILNWLLRWSRSSVRAYACAADADQAKLIRDAMEREATLNPWVGKGLRIGNKVAFGPGGSLEILAADAASAHGKSPDFLVLDEITHWHSKDFFDAIYSARDKRPRCVTIILTNAGVRGSWQWDLREIASKSPHWKFYEQPQGVQLASWMSAEKIAESRKMLTLSEARRLHDNVWIDPGEECGFVTLSEAEACESPDLTPLSGGRRGRRYIAAVDYGERRDRTALPVLDMDSLEVVRFDVWQGSPQAPIQIEAVEGWIDRTLQDFPNCEMVVDPYQMKGTIQKLERRVVRVHTWEARGGKANYALAQNLRTLILGKRIRWWRGCGAITHPHNQLPLGHPSTLTSELAEIITRSMSYGYRIDTEASGHDDRAVALGMAAYIATQAPHQALPIPPVILNPPPRRLQSVNWAAQRGLYGVTR